MSNPLKAAAAILGLLLVALLGAWLAAGRPRLLSDPNQHTDSQATVTPAPASRPAIPPLDVAAALTKTETATFALG